MKYLIIAYPEVSSFDYGIIQTIRQRYDKRYFSIVRPHITLLFGTEKFNAKSLSDHAKQVISDFKPINLRFDSAKVVQDDSGTFYHTFAVPSDGYDEIIRLHDALYSGKLMGELREDIPYIPHVGIGTSDDEAEMQSLADQINASGMSMMARLSKLTVVQYDGNKVVDIEEIPLT